MNKERELACMRDLHEVLLRYDAELRYTINDDGIHLEMEGRDIAIFFFREDLAKTVQAVEGQLQKIVPKEDPQRGND